MAIGTINIMGQYDDNTTTINIDVINATDLTPKDFNGLSDPFVQLR